MSRLIGSAWSHNTLKSRNSQWSRFISFCQRLGLTPLPATPRTVARFLVWQSKSSKYSTCNNYLSAIVVLHKYYGYDVEFRENFMIKLVLKGIKSVLGDKTVQKRPFTVDELMSMYAALDFTSQEELLCWSAMITSFRTLLRKSNLVTSVDSENGHVLRRRDVSFHAWGMLVNVSSTKTLRHSEYVLDLPVHYVGNAALCAASAVKYHMDNYPAPQDSPLFVSTADPSQPLKYVKLLGFVKHCAQRIGIPPSEVGCHSLRRSGAAHMHSIGVPLSDIMSIGDWSSLAVLDYLVTPRDRKDSIQSLVATSLS